MAQHGLARFDVHASVQYVTADGWESSPQLPSLSVLGGTVADAEHNARALFPSVGTVVTPPDGVSRTVVRVVVTAYPVEVSA